MIWIKVIFQQSNHKHRINGRIAWWYHRNRPYKWTIHSCTSTNKARSVRATTVAAATTIKSNSIDLTLLLLFASLVLLLLLPFVLFQQWVTDSRNKWEWFESIPSDLLNQNKLIPRFVEINSSSSSSSSAAIKTTTTTTTTTARTTNMYEQQEQTITMMTLISYGTAATATLEAAETTIEWNQL